MWTSPILVSEKVLLCSFGCGGVNTIAFSWQCVIHYGISWEGLAFTLLWAWGFSPSVWRRPLDSGGGLQQYS